ncbi:Ig domain-containing protein [Arthrobacter sp. 18067]|uniref:Ig domain-containing protein n=1 Tax=Arthrobacter sp. 18067 TaxID=2681413 RepID=UPI00135BA31D|nr:Ig domain-containing protein [Arthrobacter sp. 18067]
MGAFVWERRLFGKATRLLLVGAVASALALQFAPPGMADAEVPAPSAGLASHDDRGVVEPTLGPIATPPATPEPTPSPSVTSPVDAKPQPAITEPSTPITTEPTLPGGEPQATPAPTTGVVHAAAGEVPAAEAEPLAVRSYVEYGYVGKPYDAPLVISGGTAPYTAAVTNLPPGVTFDESTLSFVGSPTAEAFATAVVTVTDSSAPPQVITQDVSVTVWDYFQPHVQAVSYTGEFQDGILGVPYNAELRIYTAGSMPYTLTWVSGELPPGLSPSGKIIAGTPTTVGTYSFTVRVADEFSSTEASFSITVRASAPLGIGYIVPPAVLGEPYSAKIAEVTGGAAPYDFWWSTPRHSAGSLWWHDPGPDGLRIDANGMLNGTPTSAGTFWVQVGFRDAGLVEREIFWTTVTVLATRPPVVEQPPAPNPPAAVDAPAPPAAVTPAGALASTSGTELAATGLPSGSLTSTLWVAAGLLAVGAALAAGALRRPWRRTRA